MVAIAILALDPMLRASLEQAPREDPSITVVGAVDSLSALLELAEKHRIDVVLAEARLDARFTHRKGQQQRPVRILILDRTDEVSDLDALSAGASAILPRTVSGQEIVAAINAAAQGFILLQRERLHALLNSESRLDDKLSLSDDEQGALTPRELEVLAAMADGLSNKAIARRLAISFHTAKFHVAAILEKLGAETRTEAVMKAAQRGMVML
jgi:DNA-binding NarL/FixJ family response regulator